MRSSAFNVSFDAWIDNSFKRISRFCTCPVATSVSERRASTLSILLRKRSRPAWRSFAANSFDVAMGSVEGRMGFCPDATCVCSSPNCTERRPKLLMVCWLNILVLIVMLRSHSSNRAQQSIEQLFRCAQYSRQGLVGLLLFEKPRRFCVEVHTRKFRFNF